MQKNKSLILVVAILGLITTLVVGTRNQTGPFSEMNGLLQKSMSGTTAPSTMMATEDMMISPEEPMMGRGGAIMPDYYYGNDALEVSDRVYEKYANYSVVSRDVTQYLNRVKEYILSIDGRVLHSSYNTQGRYLSGSLQARVPVEHFEAAQIQMTQDVKKVLSENVSAEDRTGQLVGSQDSVLALQKQKEELELQLAEVTDDAERRRLELQLSRLETQIENAQKQVENVENRVEYANISVYVTNNERSVYSPMSGDLDLRGEIERAWYSISGILISLAKLALWVLVYGVLWLPAVLVVKWLKSKKTKS